MGQFPGNFRALDVDQFSALMKRFDRIGSELETLNDHMARLVEFADEITRVEEDESGSPEQGPSSNTHSTISTEG